jgi:hypothetical protein
MPDEPHEPGRADEPEGGLARALEAEAKRVLTASHSFEVLGLPIGPVDAADLRK